MRQKLLLTSLLGAVEGHLSRISSQSGPAFSQRETVIYDNNRDVFCYADVDQWCTCRVVRIMGGRRQSRPGHRWGGRDQRRHVQETDKAEEQRVRLCCQRCCRHDGCAQGCGCTEGARSVKYQTALSPQAHSAIDDLRPGFVS